MGSTGFRQGERLTNHGSQPAGRREVECFTQRSAAVLSCWPQTAHQRDPSSDRECFIDIRKRTAGHAEGTEASARSHQAERGCADIATNAVEHHIDTLVDLVFPVSPAVVDDLLSAQFAGDGELALAAGSGDHAGAR